MIDDLDKLILEPITIEDIKLCKAGSVLIATRNSPTDNYFNRYEDYKLIKKLNNSSWSQLTNGIIALDNNRHPADQLFWINPRLITNQIYDFDSKQFILTSSINWGIQVNASTNII